MDVKISLPLLPLRDIVVFPSMVIPLFVGRDKSISALNEVMKKDKKIILKAGFKKVKIQYYQRYNLANHFGWFIKRKPGGHLIYKEYFDEQINKLYFENLKKLGQTDTLIAVAG